MIELSYGTVREYNRFLDILPDLTFQSGDLKNYQRPWVVYAVMQRVPAGSRVLEIGADKCELASFLQRQGYTTWAIDVYDRFGGGSSTFKEIKAKYSTINIVKGFMHQDTMLPDNYFDAIYSCSVLEHNNPAMLRETFRRIDECLRPGGFSIHAIDFTVDGPLLCNASIMDEILTWHGCSTRAQTVAEQALSDVETFYLSPAGHYGWRTFLNKTYDDYPYRKVISLNIVHQKNSAPHAGTQHS